MRQYQPTSWIILIFFPYLEGQIGYAILPMIARGQMLGLDKVATGFLSSLLS